MATQAKSSLCKLCKKKNVACMLAVCKYSNDVCTTCSLNKCHFICLCIVVPCFSLRKSIFSFYLSFIFVCFHRFFSLGSNEAIENRHLRDFYFQLKQLLASLMRHRRKIVKSNKNETSDDFYAAIPLEFVLYEMKMGFLFRTR